MDSFFNMFKSSKSSTRTNSMGNISKKEKLPSINSENENISSEKLGPKSLDEENLSEKVSSGASK